MKTLKIHQANWTSHHFASKQIKASVFLGAIPLADNLAAEILYIVTLTDLENTELLTKDFRELDHALEYLNEYYGHWDLSESKTSKEGDGCSSCDAH